MLSYIQSTIFEDILYISYLRPHAISFLASSSIFVDIFAAMNVLSTLPSRHAASAVLYVWVFGCAICILILCSHLNAMTGFFTPSFAQAPMVVVYDRHSARVPR